MTRIGFFDSGIGGLTVLSEAWKTMPEHTYIYYADTRNVPYGKKTKSEILTYCRAATEFLITQNVDAIVVACNTGTSAAIGELRAHYSLPIIGMEPAVKPAVESLDIGKSSLVLATTRTLELEKFKNLVIKTNAQTKIHTVAMDGLVSLAERMMFEGVEVGNYIKSKLENVDWSDIQNVVLGCTHFLFFEDLLKSYLPEGIEVIDGNQGTINHLRTLVSGQNAKDSQEQRSLTFYSSGIEVNDHRRDILINLLNTK